MNDVKWNWQQSIWEIDDYIPTEAQRAFLECPNRLKLVSGGIRAGKSRSTARDFDGELFTEKGLVWIVGPDYEQGKPEWRYLLDPLLKLGVIADYSEAEKGSLVFTTNWGCRVQTKSSKDLLALASFAPNAILMVEAGQQPYAAYQKCLERALEHNAKVTLSGTFEGSLSWYVDLYEHGRGPNLEGLASFSIPSWSNTAKFPGGRDDEKIKALEAGMPEELFMERCGAQPYKPSGLVFRKQFDRERHVKRIDFDPNLPVELAIDPGQHTYAVEVVQWSAQNVWVIDEIYMHDATAYDIIPIVESKPWYKFLEQSAGVIDIAGTHHQANKSQIEVWQELTGKSLRSHYVPIQDGIDALKLRLSKDDPEGNPLLTFDFRLRDDKNYAGQANGILAEFGLFRWPEWSEGHRQSRVPIDSNCDGVKGLWYWLYDKFGPVVERGQRGSSIMRRGWY